MFGWLKSLFGNETEVEHVAPPPLPSKVKKAEKIIVKKVSKRTPKKKNDEALPTDQVSEPTTVVEKAPATPKKKTER